jgi:excisionase family DNA binding protein
VYRRQILRRSRRKCEREHDRHAGKTFSGMLMNVRKRQDVSRMPANSVALEEPLVASPNQTMRAIQVSRKKLYELINEGELESCTEGKSRRITIKSINEYIERRLAAEAARRGRVDSRKSHQSRP